MPTIEDIRTKAIPILRANGVEYAALFGSAARGEARGSSDIDMLVRFSQDISLLDHIGVAYELADALGRKVDLVSKRALLESRKAVPTLKSISSVVMDLLFTTIVICLSRIRSWMAKPTSLNHLTFLASPQVQLQ